MKQKLPERLVRAMNAEVDVDVEARILKRAQFMTRRLATDGGIVVPEGINVRFFEANPVVLAMHGNAKGFPVVGRSLGLKRNELGMESITQFADTETGRELAYLYGVNPKKEVYARGWSFGWDNVELETWTLAHAKEWLGADWDEEGVPPAARRYDEVWVSLRTILNEYSVVPLGADRDALSRAFSQGNVRLAGEMLADVDLTAATEAVAELRRQQAADRARIERLEAHIQALRGEGASAAARGDSEAVRRELEGLLGELRKR